MTHRILATIFTISAIALLSACAGAGAGGGGGGDDSDTTTVSPPENLVGTFAMDDGTSAVMDIQIDGSSSSSSISAAATSAVTGNVRYDRADYVVGGLFDDTDGSLDLIAENESSGDPKEGWQFLFSGTYTEADGFSGTVRLLDDGGTEQAKGSASAAGVTNEEKGNADTFIGTYGGSAYGSWNGVVTSNRFYGTYASADGTGEAGSFSASVSGGDSVSGTADNSIPFGGTVSGSRDFISGWWAGQTEYDGTDYPISGTWAGAQVDTSGDPPDVTSGLGGELKANLVLQTVVNLVVQAEGGIDYNNLSNGDNSADVSGVAGLSSATFNLPGSSGFNELTLDVVSGGYTDPITNITIGDGEIVATYGPSWVFNIRDALSIEVDSNATGNDTDDGGVTITYGGDSSTENLYVNGTIDGDTSSLSSTWEVEHTDARADFEGALF